MSDEVPIPMRPTSGGDLNTLINVMGEDFVVRRLGKYTVEPKLNGWRLLIDLKDKVAYTRHRTRATLADKHLTPALEKVYELFPYYGDEDQPRWLDAEGLERRHDFAKGSIVLLDVITPHEHHLRRRLLTEQVKIAPISISQWKDNPPLLSVVPNFAIESEYQSFYNRLKADNEKSGVEFYEGLVAKQKNSLYVPMRAVAHESAEWTKYRFV